MPIPIAPKTANAPKNALKHQSVLCRNSPVPCGTGSDSRTTFHKSSRPNKGQNSAPRTALPRLITAHAAGRKPSSRQAAWISLINEEGIQPLSFSSQQFALVRFLLCCSYPLMSYTTHEIARVRRKPPKLLRPSCDRGSNDELH